MKKLFFLTSAIFLLFAQSAFAAIEVLPQEKKPAQFIQFDYARSLNRGVDRNENVAGIEYNFDWQPFSGFFGLQSQPGYFDLLFRTSYLPFAGHHENGVWRFGASTACHLQVASGSYMERDILQEIEARWISAKNLTFCVRTGYVWRITSFDAIENFSITDGDFAASAEVDKLWPNGLELFTSLGTYSLYRYPLFFCPQWTFGAAYNIKKTIRLGAVLDLSMTDFWASVAYFNRVLVKCNVRFLF